MSDHLGKSSARMLCPSTLGVALALTFAAARPVSAAAFAPPARDVCGRSAPLPVVFRFNVGAAPAGAAIAPDGGVYVGTAEGYVHALRDDGSYRWSYTLVGPVIGRPVVAADSGALFVPTARRIYALRPSGRLLWVFRSPVRIGGDLALDGQGRVHFGSEDGRLFALSQRGALVAHVPGRSRFSAAPVSLPDGAVAAGRADGTVVVSSRAEVTRFALPSAVTGVLGCPGARVCALAGALHALGAQNRDFRVPALAAAGNAEFLAVLASETEIELFRGPERERLYRARLPEAASAAPALSPIGDLVVPLVSGTVLTLDRDGRARGCTSLGSSTLATPLIDAARRRAIVLSREGLVSSLGLE